MKLLKKSMGRLFVIVFSFCMMTTAFSQTMAGSIKVHAEETLDLSGFWKTEGKDGTWLEMYIDGEMVSVYWTFNDGDENAVYWIGTYTSPAENIDEYIWVSERDAEKTDDASLASRDDTKDFTYSDGVISIPLSSFGIKTTQYFYQEDLPDNPAEPPFELDTASSDTLERQNASVAVRNYVTPEFEEQVLVDNDECTIIITGIDDDSSDYTLDVYLENKSDEITYTFASFYGSINGLEMYLDFDENVAPGKKCNSQISFGSIANYGISTATDVGLRIGVFDANDSSSDELIEEVFHVYPVGKESASKYERKPQDSDIILSDTDEATMIITGFEEDDIWGYTANLYLDNKSDTTIMFSVDDVSVNGYMIDPFWADSVPAGECTYTSMSWSNSKLEENSIDPSNIAEIEMTLHIRDDDDWDAEDFVNNVVTVNP